MAVGNFGGQKEKLIFGEKKKDKVYKQNQNAKTQSLWIEKKSEQPWMNANEMIWKISNTCLRSIWFFDKNLKVNDWSPQQEEKDLLMHWKLI